MATKLPKMGGQKKKNKRELWQTSCQKLREKFNSNLCIEVARNEGKKEEDLDRKLEEKKNFRQWNCRNGREKKKLWQLIYGNGIAKMRGKKICGNVVAKM